MQPEDMILVSVDDHLVEPPNLFDGRLPPKYADAAPRVIRRPAGSERTAGATLGTMSAKLDV
ncbi:hypothetical protein BRW65_08675 [Mycobacterium paraffinicum]|uniref:Amidohydrolase n=1 Tax=Mycobacterium paraffinicum TaxID=53378 RepID=A0A1Q4HXB4_9MYCO|nr:hypothetical protein [Mycobacterium paraffinicum]OJZ74342.1 hypothetical protein BRW65_08675 [Mycobacterium paraffinicum]